MSRDETAVIQSAEERAERGAATQQRPPKKRGYGWKEEVYGTVFASLPLIGFLLFSVVPVGIALATMFCDMDGMNISTIRWNNFANFGKAFADRRKLRDYVVRARGKHQVFVLARLLRKEPESRRRFYPYEL